MCLLNCEHSWCCCILVPPVLSTQVPSQQSPPHGLLSASSPFPPLPQTQTGSCSCRWRHSSLVKVGKCILGGEKGWFGCLGAAARTASVSHLAILENSEPVAQKMPFLSCFYLPWFAVPKRKTQARETVRGYRSERLKRAVCAEHFSVWRKGTENGSVPLEPTLDAVSASCTPWTLEWGQEKKLAMARQVPTYGHLGKDELCWHPQQHCKSHQKGEERKLAPRELQLKQSSEHL